MTAAVRRRRLAWIAGAVAVLLFLSFQETAMGSIVLFSPVRGHVVLDGKAVAGATVEREFRWGWKDETGTDRVTTGAGGEFAFPAIVRRSFLGSLLPHEPMVRQTILIRHAGRTHKAWMYDKGNYRENGELGGRPIVLRCRLESEPAKHGEVYGICEIL